MSAFLRIKSRLAGIRLIVRAANPSEAALWKKAAYFSGLMAENVVRALHERVGDHPERRAKAAVEALEFGLIADLCEELATGKAGRIAWRSVKTMGLPDDEVRVLFVICDDVELGHHEDGHWVTTEGAIFENHDVFAWAHPPAVPEVVP